MSLGTDARLVAFISIINVLTLFLVLGVGGSASNLLDILDKPLVACEVLVGVVCFWNLCQALCLHKLFQNRIKIFQVITSVCILIGGAVLFHTIAVLFGAPLIESVAETAHFSLLLTATTLLPCCLLLGLNMDDWHRVLVLHRAETAVETVVQMSTVCSIVGAWLGAFPIPLDWDRPWQVWPISCVFGTVMGYSVGLLLGVLRLCCPNMDREKRKLV